MVYRGSLEHVGRLFGGCGDAVLSVRRVWGGCLEGVGRMSGWSGEAVWGHKEVV